MPGSPERHARQCRRAPGTVRTFPETDGQHCRYSAAAPDLMRPTREFIMNRPALKTMRVRKLFRGQWHPSAPASRWQIAHTFVKTIKSTSNAPRANDFPSGTHYEFSTRRSAFVRARRLSEALFVVRCWQRSPMQDSRRGRMETESGHRIAAA